MKGVKYEKENCFEYCYFFDFSLCDFECIQFFWCNVPVFHTSETGSTDYVFENNKYLCRCTEGFSFGKTDSNGFYNVKAIDKNDIDVLLVGSSQVEAFNVPVNKSTAYLLGNLLNKNVYSIGASAHSFVRCMHNLECAVEEFNPKTHVVVEFDPFPTVKDMRDELNGEYARIESPGWLVAKLQKLPYLRLLHVQMQSLQSTAADSAATAAPKPEFDSEEYYSVLSEFLRANKEIVDRRGLEFIIIRQYGLQIDKNGNPIQQEKDEKFETFIAACRDNGITFVDARDEFINVYKQYHKLPHGFSNTKIGAGHLNEYGHIAMANTLKKVIETGEVK